MSSTAPRCISNEKIFSRYDHLNFEVLITKYINLSAEERKRGIVCASAGNHAQGVALACNKLGIKGTIFMPVPTPKQKLGQVRMFGGSNVEIRLTGDTFDDAYAAAQSFKDETNSMFVHPFEDKDVVIGQATLALELIEQARRTNRLYPRSNWWGRSYIRCFTRI